MFFVRAGRNDLQFQTVFFWGLIVTFQLAYSCRLSAFWIQAPSWVVTSPPWWAAPMRKRPLQRSLGRAVDFVWITDLIGAGFKGPFFSGKKDGLKGWERAKQQTVFGGLLMGFDL